jgi:hypothetical protein
MVRLAGCHMAHNSTTVTTAVQAAALQCSSVVYTLLLEALALVRTLLYDVIL